MLEPAPWWIAAAVLVLAQLGAVAWLLHDRVIDRMLGGALIAYLLMWNLVPGVICLMVGASLLDARLFFDAAPAELLELYCLESALLLAVMAAARGVVAHLRAQAPHPGVVELPLPWVKGLALGFLVALLVAARIGMETSYVERNSASLHEPSTFEPLFVIVYTALRAGVLYAYLARSRGDAWTHGMLALLTLDATLETMAGARIAMVMPLFALLCRTHVRGWAGGTGTWRVMGVSAVALFVLLPLAIKIAEVRQQPNLKLADLTHLETDSEAALLSLFTKFNSFSSGLLLLDGYGPGSAGVAPYVGSVLVFVPRALVPERPMAGSVDGTLYGTPARLVPQLITDSDSYNVGVSPYAIAVWQWGWALGALVLLVVGTANLVLLEQLLGHPQALVRVLALSAIGAPTFAGLYNSPDALIKSQVQLALLLGGVAVVAWLLRRREPHAVA